MSSSEDSVNVNGKRFSSRRHLYADNNIQQKNNKNGELDKKDCASVPRHRIAGKQRMPPYIEAPTIEVPEPRRARSQSRARSGSQGTIRNGLEANHQLGSLDGISEGDDIGLTACNQIGINGPLLLNDALFMVVPKSYLPSVTRTQNDNSQSAASIRAMKESSPVLNSTDPSQSGNEKEHILGRKVPPLYIPRPLHELDPTEWDSSSATAANVESDKDENETPWGKRLAGIKVSRVKRDLDDDAVSIEAPEGTLPVCARCRVVVYLAEEKRAAGRRFHSSCFKCFLCHCSLDSMNLYERNQEAYCKSCCIRQFVPKGYDYRTGEGVLRME